MGCRLPITVCAAFVLATPAAAPAALARPQPKRNSIRLSAPPQVSKGSVYDVTLTGYARRRATAYVFIDYLKCAPTLAAENQRDAQESYVYKVRGRFAQTTGWKSAAGGTDHACAYLVSPATGALLAVARQAFQVR